MIPSSDDIHPIEYLKNQYTAGVTYTENVLTVNAKQTINNTGFFGAKKAAFISADDSINHEAPALVAAQSIAMVAKNVMKIGVAGQGTQPVPVRFYAEHFFSLVADHIQVGQFEFVNLPKNGYIACRKLTLINPTSSMENQLKRWLVNKETVVEVVKSEVSDHQNANKAQETRTASRLYQRVKDFFTSKI